MTACQRTGLCLALLMIALAACSHQTASPPPPSAPPPVISARPSLNFYTIQAGAFSSVQAAVRLADQLQQNDAEAIYFLDTDRLYKVRIGRFDTHKAAHDYATNLQTSGTIDRFLIVTPIPFPDSKSPELGEAIVQTASRFIGTPYRWGGNSRQDGVDCSGLTLTVFRLNGLKLPRSSYAQYQKGRPVPRHALKKGDLVFFDTKGGGRVSHVGIYSGSGGFIHAPGRGKDVRKASIANDYFKSRYIGARRYF
jgi:cell wall-associated NlpC family hydrolase